jgi:hypothetical protein
MDESEALKALAAVDRRMGNSRMAVVDVLLIGASAGMLSGQLPRDRTTTDCDVMDIHPAAAELLLMEAAEAVAHAHRHGIPGAGNPVHGDWTR